MTILKHMFVFCLIAFSLNALAADKTIKVYAAASLSNVLQEISREYKGKDKIVFNFDASSKLAKQIESGAPADLFFSADSDWMDYLDKQNRIVKASRADLLSNKIVVIIPADSKKIPTQTKDLLDPFYHHIALAGEAVPAGKFAREALKSEGLLTDSFNKKVVNADNVRVALSWVAGHEAAAGVVYATDVLVEPKVKVAFSFKDGTYPKIIYPGAVVQKSESLKEAQEFLHFCKTPKAKEIFAKAGFINI
jgi:molybdate transport system substrate-binding protein